MGLWHLGNARGRAEYELEDEGTRLSFEHRFVDLPQPIMAHLHLAPAGENGPVVAFLFDPENPPPSLVRPTPGQVPGGGLAGPAPANQRRLSGELTASDLTGPLEGQPLDALIQEILDGNIYINIHTQRVPSGEIRGQLLLEE
ncbi:MAG: CHRD domain-containing protein [Candidatus Competibacteraceae bacterium]|nr:CHRD domain-containing protein [Candidatus Competibacteraceae bacterium]